MQYDESVQYKKSQHTTHNILRDAVAHHDMMYIYIYVYICVYSIEVSGIHTPLHIRVSIQHKLCYAYTVALTT